MIQFAKEPLTDALWAEAMPLLEAHWKEVAHFQDIPLNPDREVYAASEEAGILRVFTARDPQVMYHGEPCEIVSQSREVGGWFEIRLRGGLSFVVEQDKVSCLLVGYALYFVRSNPHYSSSVQAIQDVLYLAKEHRGRTALKFIAWCDEQLQAEGCQAVYQHIKTALPHAHRALVHLGYTAVDTIYAKRLDRVVRSTEWIESRLTAYHDAMRTSAYLDAAQIEKELTAAGIRITTTADGTKWVSDERVMGQDWTDQAQHDYNAEVLKQASPDYDTARFVGVKP